MYFHISLVKSKMSSSVGSESIYLVLAQCVTLEIPNGNSSLEYTRHKLVTLDEWVNHEQPRKILLVH